MSASTVMAVAIVSGVVGRWAHNKPTVPSGKTIVEVVFAFVLIAALDQGRTQQIASGFAWLMLAAVLLSKNSPLTGIAATINRPAPKSAPKAKKGKK